MCQLHLWQLYFTRYYNNTIQTQQVSDIRLHLVSLLFLAVEKKWSVHTDKLTATIQKLLVLSIMTYFLDYISNTSNDIDANIQRQKTNYTNRECFQAFEVEDKKCVACRRVSVATSVHPRIPRRCCRTGSRAPAGTLVACPRTASPSADPSPRGRPPAGCQSRWPLPETSPPDMDNDFYSHYCGQKAG